MSDDPRRALGQYFSPPVVVDFALDALSWLEVGAEGAEFPDSSPVSGLTPAEDENGHSQPSRETAARPDASRRFRGNIRVIDPACGDAAFLRRAITRGLVDPDHAFGMDKDPALQRLWEAESGPVPHLAVADGLLAEAIGGHAVTEASFDWVVGNPPYAGRGLKDESIETLALILERFELARRRFNVPDPPPPHIRRLPVEVLFVERFCRLCRPGGLIAIILPVGIFANDRWRFVREWLLPQVTAHAVVGLPRTAFRAGGITAKTCLLLARKAPAPRGHEVLLAEVENLAPDGFAEVMACLRGVRCPAPPDKPWLLP